MPWTEDSPPSVTRSTSTTHAEGSTFTSKLHKRDGEERHIGGEYDGTGRYAKQEVPVDAYPFKVSGSRTISTGRYAFARVSFTMEVYVRADQRDEAFDYVSNVVTEVLEREEHGLRRQKRDPKDIEDTPLKMWGRVITFEYGLTLPMPGYESRKIDIGLTEPIDDDASLEESIGKVQAWIIGRLDEKQRETEKDDGSDTGL